MGDGPNFPSLPISVPSAPPKQDEEMGGRQEEMDLHEAEEDGEDGEEEEDRYEESSFSQPPASTAPSPMNLLGAMTAAAMARQENSGAHLF